MNNEGPPRVLVIDDSRSCRALVAKLLGDEGYEVHLASNGIEGAELATSARFDVIVVDHVMLEMTGTQLCRLLSSDVRTARIPVVVLTGRTSRRGLFWAIESGASAYLSKSELGDLPALVGRLRASPRAVSSPSYTGAARRSVLGRLGDLFDTTLLACVVRKHVQSIATTETTTRGAVASVATLLATMVEFRWLAIELRGDRAGQWVLAHPDDDSGRRAASAALSPRPSVAIEPLADGRCTMKCAEEHRVALALEFGIETVGTLIVSLDASESVAENARLVEQVSSEFASVIKLVSLLESATTAAMSDELTGVPNRRAARDFLLRSSALADRYTQPLCVAMADIDYFKRVNDTYGHDAGDDVLRAVAATLLRGMRASDMLARWGGEEFMLVFPQTAIEGAMVVCERLRASVAALLVNSGSNELRVSVSMGVSMLDSSGLDAMLRRADESLYAAKERGRNRVVVDRDVLQRIA